MITDVIKPAERQDTGNKNATSAAGEIEMQSCVLLLGKPVVARPRETIHKSAITIFALVSPIAISILPIRTYRIVDALTARLISTVEYAMYLILQLNPLLDPPFFAVTQKDIRTFYAKKIRGLIH